jgi:hypothetical protein
MREREDSAIFVESMAIPGHRIGLARALASHGVMAIPERLTQGVFRNDE